MARGDSGNPIQQAIAALQRIEEARRAEEAARREQQGAWGRLQEALAELRSSSPSLQAMPVEALLQTGPGGAPGPGRAASVFPVVAPSKDGAGSDDDGLPPGPGDDYLAERPAAWPADGVGDPVLADDDELVLAEWDLPPGLDEPVEGENDADGFWKGVLLTDDDVEGAATDPFPASE
jgi:hypothetical protein